MDKKRVLFIGNSLTFYNYGLDNTLKWLSKDRIITKTFYCGGQNLEYHWQRDGMQDMIKNGNWDYVVIQESAWTLFKEKDGKSTQEYAAKFTNLINKSGAKTIFYAVPTYSDRWFHKNKLIKGSNPKKFTQKIYSQYQKTYEKLKKNNLIIAPCGDLFYDYIKQNRDHSNFEATMYDKDLCHPSFKTTYMFSLILLSIIDNSLYSDAPDIFSTFKIEKTQAELKRVLIDKDESKQIIRFVKEKIKT
jgi:hypothetical protein